MSKHNLLSIINKRRLNKYFNFTKLKYWFVKVYITHYIIRIYSIYATMLKSFLR